MTSEKESKVSLFSSRKKTMKWFRNIVIASLYLVNTLDITCIVLIKYIHKNYIAFQFIDEEYKIAALVCTPCKETRKKEPCKSIRGGILVHNMIKYHC
jgi:hypothetical protein